MSAHLLKKLVRQRVREIHAKSAAGADGYTVDAGMKFVNGFKSNGKLPADTSRKMRREIERKMLKQLRKPK